MKKLILTALTAIMMLSFAACSSAPATKEVEGDLETLIGKIYENLNDAELPNMMTTPLTAENEEYFIGAKGIKYTEGLASEPMINAIPHSLVLVRLEKDADVEAAKTAIKDNVNGRKWICVGVEDDQIIVENIGSLVMLVMDENAQAYVEAFKKLGQ